MPRLYSAAQQTPVPVIVSLVAFPFSALALLLPEKVIVCDYGLSKTLRNEESDRV